jgi:hypothetical protein
MESGPADVGEAHPVLITGEAANVAHRIFKNLPNGFLALGSGKLKTFNNLSLEMSETAHLCAEVN